MKIFNALAVSCCLFAQGGHGYSIFNNKSVPTGTVSATDDASSIESATTTSRRNMLRAAAALSAGAMLGNINPGVALADDDVATPCYFGVGCFWHIQHEFVEQGEKGILGRGPTQYTSAAGYAGGKSTDKEGRVCYHNFSNIADYGKLGHGEVVGMTIPQNKVGDFSELYFSLYNPKTKDRVDPMDRGAEYRSLIGLPGGMKHASYPSVASAAEKAGYTLLEGRGNDPDTLGKQVVYVYDSTKFPFYQAEVYHQYHNDFQSPAYGKAYNNLVEGALEDGRIKSTGCPDRW